MQSAKAGADVRSAVTKYNSRLRLQAQNLALSPDGNHVTAQVVDQIIMRSVGSREQEDIAESLLVVHVRF